MPLFDISSATQLSISFDYAYKLWSVSGYSDTLEVLVSNSCNGSYKSIWKTYGQNLVTSNPYYITSSWHPSGSSDWSQVSLNLVPYLSGDTLSIKFRNITDYENNLFLDNINVDFTIPTVVEEINRDDEWASVIYDDINKSLIISETQVRDMKLEVFDIAGKKIVEQGVLSSDQASKHSLRLPVQTEGVYIYRLSSSLAKDLKGKFHRRYRCA